MGIKARTTREAAAAVGITRATLQAWIAAKKICPPRPTTFGNVTVRIWSEADVRDLGEAKKRLYRKGRGRKPVSSN
jgi:hypothetical protein